VNTGTKNTLGRYRIEAEIGRGAMGVVYRGFDPQIDRTVAIKTISLAGQDPEAEQQFRERFSQEARAAGRLSHPGIVTIYDAAEDPETHEPYIVMEYIPGEPLSKILAETDGKLPLSAALQFAQEIAEALDYAHSQGVIHRDIKPANILVTEDGHAKIADFGVARLNQELVSQQGGIVGSPAYMAPEQMSEGEADARSDLFSLGVILYSMITGFRPFQGNSAQTVCFKVMNVEPVPVTSFQTDVPPELDALIARAIAKDPNERYQSGAQMARDIQAFRQTDVSLSEETAFFARVVRRNLGLPGQKPPTGWKFSQSLAVAAVAVAIATSVFAWRESHIRKSAQIVQPPANVTQTAVAQNQQNSPPQPIPKVRPRKSTVKKTAKPAATAPSPAPTAAPDPLSAKVDVEIEHHFAAGKASIWLDDQLIYERNLHGASQRHPLFRAVEMHQVTSFQISAGKHQLQIRVVSPNSYDQIETVDAELQPGSEHVLTVNCDNKKQMLVALK
jgi:serine/threonine protein kinase